jgi:transposase
VLYKILILGHSKILILGHSVSVWFSPLASDGRWSDDVFMDQASGAERRVRRWRTVAEKRQIVNLTLEPGASVALVARAHGLNANQVFKWRRAFERGELVDSSAASTALLPVTVAPATETEIQDSASQRQSSASGSIHIEFPGRAMISVEIGADPALLRSILESLRK